MKLLFGVLFLSFAVTTLAVRRIIGGTDAADGSYTYQVSLRIGNHSFCGGSIIDKRWILTAAHCVNAAGTSRVTVMAGTNLLQGSNAQVYETEYLTYPSGFNHHLVDDIGLIRVSKDIQFNDKVQPIALPQYDDLETGHTVKLTGWGDTKKGGSSSNSLQAIDLKVYDQASCKKELAKYAEITDYQICTKTRPGEGSCTGDSGSPLVADGVQVGIVSFGIPCGVGFPDVFTRVYNFLNWIAYEQAKF